MILKQNVPGKPSPQEYEVFISPIPKTILGLVSYRFKLQTSISEFYLWVRVIKQMLIGNDREPLSLLPPQTVVLIKQDKLSGSVRK